MILPDFRKYMTSIFKKLTKMLCPVLKLVRFPGKMVLTFSQMVRFFLFCFFFLFENLFGILKTFFEYLQIKTNNHEHI